MGFMTGMKNIAAATTSSDDSYVKRLRISDGQSVKIRIISELDESSPNYDPKRGLAGLHMQHESPLDWKRKCQCTKDDEGRCRGCEKYGSDKKLKAKKRFYINVLVDDGIEEPYVAVWDMATYKTPAYDAIWDRFMDTKSVSNLVWKLKRTGAGQQDTTYTFQPVSFDTEPFAWPADIEPFDLKTVVEYIPYDKQDSFYGDGTSIVESDSDEGQEWV